MMPITTIVRSAVSNGLSFTVVCVLGSSLGKPVEQYRYQVCKIDESGITLGIAYESNGSKEYCFEAFANRETSNRK